MDAQKVLTAQHIRLLYVSGEDLDWQIVSAIVSQFQNYQLGPHCWLIKAPQDVEMLRQLQAMLPPAPSKSELLYFPVADEQIRLVTQSGWGLGAWLDAASGAKQLP